VIGVGRLVIASAVTCLAVCAPARASFIITPTFDSTITGDSNHTNIINTINSVIQVYQNTLLDNITVAIEFHKAGGLGSSSSFFGNVTYAQYLAALTADKKSADDTTALAHLGAGPNNPVNGTAEINVKTANLRAIGISAAVAFDGLIGINLDLTDIGSSGTTGQKSLVAVLEHEIDEVLGLGSALPNPNGALSGDPFPEDLFRYNSTGGRSFTASPATAYFSIDSTTLIARFHNTNDGADYGDWETGAAPPQVQDAFATVGSFPTLGPSEIRALDVIGFDLAVPEPATGVLFGTALLFVVLAKRRADKRTNLSAN
jgi:hypothetical protein